MFDDEAQKNYEEEVKRSQFFSQITVQVSQLEKTNIAQGIMVIQTNYISTSQLVAVVVRKISQFDALVQYLTMAYGGRLIPCYNYEHGTQLTNAQQVKKIQQYLIDMKSHSLCSRDLKLYEFIFFQIVEFPEQQTFYKILSKATIFSRTYLNNFFTRRQLDKDVEEYREFMIAYKKVQQFSQKFTYIKDIVLILLQEQQTLQNVMSDLSEISSKMSLNASYNESQTIKARSQILHIQKQLAFTYQANQRVQLLNVNIRQIKANINKGLHDQKREHQYKEKLLKNWTLCLSKELSRLLQEIVQLCQKISTNVYIMSKMQFEENCLVKYIAKNEKDNCNERLKEITQQVENEKNQNEKTQDNENGNQSVQIQSQNQKNSNYHQQISQEVSLQPQQQNVQQVAQKSKNTGQQNTSQQNTGQYNKGSLQQQN